MSTRYVLHDPIGSGGMATVHIGQLHAPLGFTRAVAIKRLHPALSHQPEFAAMLVDEARITARVRHLNVIPTLDVFLDNGECMLVMEYVEGESLGKLLRSASQAGTPVPVGVVSAVLAGVLHGLHAAHVAKSGSGEPLNIIHRDVSPQNILVGGDGIARIFDFGVAKALGRLQQTRAGEFKGKLPYLAPEQFSEGAPDRRVDVYAASVTLWEALTARRLFDGASEEEVFGKILQSRIPAPSELRPGLSPALDELVLRGLSRSPSARFASAEEMALALEQAAPPATAREVSAWLHSLASEALAKRAALVTEMDGRDPAPLPAVSAVPAVPAPAVAAPTPAAAARAPAVPEAFPPVGTTVPLPPPPVAPELQKPTATLRMTVPLRARQRRPSIPDASFAAPSAPSSLSSLAEAPTVVGQRGPAPAALELPAVEPGGRRRLLVRASLGALLLLCSLAAPAFGWMAFSGQDAPPPVAPASAQAAPKLERVIVSDTPNQPLRAAEPKATPTPTDAKPPEPSAAAVKSPQATTPSKPVTARPPGKTKPATSAPDYLSSPPFSQRR
jgi:serine/threonine-protein kinase